MNIRQRYFRVKWTIEDRINELAPTIVGVAVMALFWGLLAFSLIVGY